MLKLFAPLYLLLILPLFTFDTFITEVVDSVSTGAFEDDAIADFEGGFYMAEQLLLNTPKAQWPQQAERMSSRNIPFQVRPLASLTLTEEQRQTLLRGDTLVILGDDELLRKMPDSDDVISFGPVSTIEELDSARSTAVLAYFLILILLMGLWAWDVFRRIRHLQNANRAFGEGCFDVRAKVGGLHQLGHLNRDFNAMAEQIQQLIESHKMLVNAVSHELRTPIARIRFELDHAGYLERADDMKISFDSIAEDTAELEKMVSELLLYARYERDHLQLPMTRQSLPLWLQEWHQELRLAEPAMAVDVAVDVDVDVAVELAAERVLPSAAPESHADIVAFNPEAMQRALDNLVGNACRYAKSRVQISVNMEPDQCYLLVDDDGPGIPLAQRQQLFDPFVRGDKSRTRETGGHGLGLAIVKQILERHQGSVHIEDSPLGGARFVMRWPAQR